MQRDEGTHENQRRDLEKWAQRNGHDIEIFEDIAISGQSDDRPEYENMMQRAPEFDAVVVRDLSRFGRSLKDVLKDIEELQEHNTEFISITESFDTSNAMGKAMMQMIGVFNEFWANLARERAQTHLERQRANGEPIGRPRKLQNEDAIKDLLKWRELGLSYAKIATLIEDGYGVELHRDTVRRYVEEHQE